MWDKILTKPLQDRAFREFRAELISRLVDYEYESKREDVENNAGVSNTNYVQKVNSNALYRSYAEATIATIKSPMASP